MKFGIKVPATVEEARLFDAENGDTIWQDAINKEIANSRIAFEVLEEGESAPVGYTQITCHLIFDVKMDLTRKARYVAGGHLTHPPTSMTYASVVERETVRIAFLIASLNDLKILAGNIQNAYLNAHTKEKIFFYLGDEWKGSKERVVIITSALYGLKSLALMWRNHLADILGNKLKFRSSLSDPDLWYKEMISTEGVEYYAYILVYVDNILILDKDPERFMQVLKEEYKVKPGSIGKPKVYLGAGISKAFYPDGSYTWLMSSSNYVREALCNIKKDLKQNNLQFNKKLSDPNYLARTPFCPIDYRSELDTTMLCHDSSTNYFQNLIGVLRWIVELSQRDIAFESSSLSKFLSYLSTRHIYQALHIYKYLETHIDNDLLFDLMYHDFANLNQNYQKIDEMKKI